LRATPAAVVEPAHAAFEVTSAHRLDRARLTADMLRFHARLRRFGEFEESGHDQSFPDYID
jgi:hypothetical protein